MQQYWRKSTRNVTYVYKNMIQASVLLIVIATFFALARPEYRESYLYGTAIIIPIVLLIILFNYHVYEVSINRTTNAITLRRVNLFGSKKSETLDLQKIDCALTFEKQSRNSERCWILQLRDGNKVIAKIEEKDFKWTKEELEEIHNAIRDNKKLSTSS